MIRPTTSSSIAADNRTIPILVFRNSGELLKDERIANVVPREVEHNAAPAVNPCRGVAPNAKTKQRSESPIGVNIPTKATLMDRTTFAFKRSNLVDNPPGKVDYQYFKLRFCDLAQTLEDEEDESEIP